MRFPSTLAGRFLATAGSIALCVGLGASAARSEDARSEYRLGPGDVMQVTVVGQSELSGKYRVGPEGGLVYPVVGSISVANKTLSEVTTELSSRLSQRVPVRNAPAVEIFEFAPVVVTGDVEKPGQYPYRPGMVALELVALAGGERRTAAALESRALQLIQAEQAAEARRLTLFASRAQRARLQAEISGVAFEPKIEELMAGASVDTMQARKLARNEQDLFAVRQKVQQNQITALRDQRENFNREIDALRESIKLHNGEIALLEQEVQNSQRLLDKGLGLLPALLGLKRQLSATRRDALDIESSFVRAQQSQLQTDQKIQDVGDQQKKENASAMRELDVTIAQIERQLGGDNVAVAEMRAQLGRDTAAPPPVTYRVARLVDGAYKDMPVDDYARLAPRDILRAVRAAPGKAQPNTAAATQGARDDLAAANLPVQSPASAAR